MAAIFAFSIAPLRAAAILGLIAIVLSTLFSIYSLVAKFFFHQSPKGFTALILVVTFLSGVNLFFLGVIGEYVGRIYDEARHRPKYIVQSRLGWGDDTVA